MHTNNYPSEMIIINKTNVTAQKTIFFGYDYISIYRSNFYIKLYVMIMILK